MKKRFLGLLLLAATALTACGGGQKAEDKKDAKPTIGTQKDGYTVVKVGVTGGDSDVWDVVNQNLEKDKIKVEKVVFDDYVQPNLALAEKSIDLNAFQHVIYFEDFKAKHNLDLSILNYTYIAPMGFYSQKIKSIDEIKDGDSVAIPNDATNGGRALLILQANGLIKVKEGTGLKPTVADVVENPKNLKFVELQAQQTARALTEVTFAAINDGIAKKAGVPYESAIFREDPNHKDAKNYWNLIAIRTEDKDNEVLQKVRNAYQKQNVIDKAKELNGTSLIPVFEVLP